MAIISGVTVRWGLSPRLIVIPLAESEVTLEDLQDTLQDIEDDSQGMPFDKLRSISGGQELDATTSVGLTMQLNNAQLIWQTNVTELETGTVTTADTNGLTLIDSAALFVTAGVVAGDMVFNSADGSHATVLRVTSETQIEVDALIGGTDNQFDSADTYTIFDWELRAVTGGNLVAVDSGATRITPVINSFGNSFDRTSSSSATFQELADVQFSSYNNGITLDIANVTGHAVAGTVFPIGTGRVPVNNYADARIIADDLGLNNIYLKGNFTAGTGDDLTGFNIRGESPASTFVTLNAGATVSNTQIFDAFVTGQIDGIAILYLCHVQDIDLFGGAFHECLLAPGDVNVTGTDNLYILDCWSGVPGSATPYIGLAASTADIHVRNYSGGIGVKNKTDAGSVNIGLNVGQVVLDSSVTTGTLTIRGVGKLTDNSIGATVNDETTTSLIAAITTSGLTTTQADQLAEILTLVEDGLTVEQAANLSSIHEAVVGQSSSEKVTEIHTRLALEKGNAITDVPGGIDSADGTIDINRTGDGLTSSTLTRQ